VAGVRAEKRILKVGLTAGIIQFLDSGLRRNDEGRFLAGLEMTHGGRNDSISLE